VRIYATELRKEHKAMNFVIETIPASTPNHRPWQQVRRVDTPPNLVIVREAPKGGDPMDTPNASQRRGTKGGQRMPTDDAFTQGAASYARIRQELIAAMHLVARRLATMDDAEELSSLIRCLGGLDSALRAIDAYA